MPDVFVFQRRVEFADTDAAGLIHFTSLLRYMEEAEHAFYRTLGIAGYSWNEDGVVGTPRVAVQCEFLGPVRYDDEVTVHLSVRKVGTKSIQYEAEFTLDEPEGRRTVARGGMTVVFAVRRHGVRNWSGEEIPRDVRDRIEAAAG